MKELEWVKGNHVKMKMEIIYLAPYADGECKERDFLVSYAGNNKILGVIDSLGEIGIFTHLISPAVVREKMPLKLYSGFSLKKDKFMLYYPCTASFPVLREVLSVISSIKLMFKIKKNNSVKALIFYNYRPETAFPAVFGKLFLKLPIILQYEDGYFIQDEIGCVKSAIFRIVEIITNRFIDGAILVSSFLLSRIKTDNYIISRGIFNPKVFTKADFSNRYNPIKVMYSGSLDYVRGVDIFLDSIPHIKSNIEVIITGKGMRVDVEKVENKVKHLQSMGKHIKCFFDIDKTEQEKFLKETHILVNPQREGCIFNKFSFPSKVIEYMSTGNIVVSSNVSDIETFSENRIIIYLNDDPNELGKAIDNIIQNFNIYKEYGDRARQWVANECSYTNVGNKIRNVIEEALRRIDKIN